MSADTGKIDNVMVPTGDIITAVGTSKNYLGAGTSTGEVILWTIEGEFGLVRKSRLASFLEHQVTFLKFDKRTPLLTISTSGGEVLILNCVDGKLLEGIQIYSLKKPAVFKVTLPSPRQQYHLDLLLVWLSERTKKC